AYLLAVLTVLIGAVAGVITDQATSGAWPSWLTVLIVVGVSGALTGWDWWRDRLREKGGSAPPPVATGPEWVVDRRDEVDEVVRKVCQRSGGAVGITTALQGAGGFGKTTLAGVVCGDPRARRRFGGRVFQVTIGRDATSPAAVAGKVNETVELITGTRPGLTDPVAAGQRLGQVLRAPPPLPPAPGGGWGAGPPGRVLLG